MSETEKTLKKIVGDDPAWSEMSLFLDGLNSESDRGAVLISSSYLEDRLGELIRRFLVEGSDGKALIDDFNGPFGTFSARIKGSHALGIIADAERDRLDTIRRIRNEFAHSLSASFAQQRIGSLTRNLKLFVGHGDELKLPARQQFEIAAAQIVISLTNRIGAIGNYQLKSVAWPPGY